MPYRVTYTDGTVEEVRTPAGLLWNEAERSVRPLLTHVTSMLRDAIAISVGGHDSAYVGVLLFVARLALYALRFAKAASPPNELIAVLRDALLNELMPVLDRWRLEADVDARRAAEVVAPTEVDSESECSVAAPVGLGELSPV